MALVFVNGYGQTSFGLVEDFDEVSNVGTLAHDGWNMGIGLGARLGLSVGPVKFGILGEFQKLQWEGERVDGDRQNSFDGDEDYDNVIDRTLYGLFVNFDPPALPVSFTVEYFPEVSGKMSFAQGVGENPFVEDDKINGRGFGLGIWKQTLPHFYGINIRSISYDNFVLNGVEADLPNDRFEKVQSWEISFQGGVSFDFL